MAYIKDALTYLLKNYPETLSDDLSNARVTKMLYLADWHQAINFGKQITNISWYFDNYGPYVNDVRTVAEANPDCFRIVSTNNIFGQRKQRFELSDQGLTAELQPEEKKSLDHVIEQTHGMFWDSFIKLVYSTYPITSSERYTKLDLLQKANEYKSSTNF